MNGNGKAGKPTGAGSGGPARREGGTRGRGPGPRDRGGRPGSRGPRETGRDERPASKGAVENAILASLREAERPLTLGDYDLQLQHFGRILEKLRGLRLKSIDELEFDARTRLFTALLRAGRQPAVEDAEKEARRKQLLALLGALWESVGDSTRAAQVYAAAGQTRPAMKLLERSGDWRELAELHRQQGEPAEAARLYEHHEDFASAMEAFKEAGEHRAWLRMALRAGRLDEAKTAAGLLPPRAAREVLFKHGQGDLFLELLAAKGDWSEIGNLYERAGQYADAAQAFERGKRLVRAAEAWRKSGDLAAAERCVTTESEFRRARGDLVGAGDVWRRFGMPGRAAEVVRESKPEQAFAWLQGGGLDQEALALARAEATRHRAAGQAREAAVWLERGGELATAAQLLFETGEALEALRLYEQLGDWARAGEAAARAGESERALEFLRRAGVADPEARLRELTGEAG